MQEEKQLQAGHVTEDGLRFATLGASKTAASILTKTVEHHQHESQQEANVEEAFEYRDSIKADIKAWAFQVRYLSTYTLLFRCRENNLCLMGLISGEGMQRMQ